MSELVHWEERAHELGPTAGGWPLRAATVGGEWKLVPPPGQMLARVLTRPAVPWVAGVLGWVLVDRGGASVIWFLRLGLGPKLLVVALLGALTGPVGRLWSGKVPALVRSFARLASRRLRRRAAVHVTAESLSASPAGSLVCVTGTVRAREPFVSAVSGKRVVLAWYETRSGHQRGHQLRGIDFMLDVDGGEAVRVAVKDAYFDEIPGDMTTKPFDAGEVGFVPIGEATYREARIVPGDRVEAIGMLVHEVDPTGATGPDRKPALRAVIRSGPRAPLLLRRL